MALQPGEIVDGKYRIIRELGSGSMGAVYEGENVRIRRRVAIKVLLPSVADRGDVVQRFEREAQAAGRIGSEHIVEVLDLGTLNDGGFYMVMEFLDGQTLRERIHRQGRLQPHEIVPIMQQLLFGLEMAHDARVIHRDLKPDNVFLMRDYSGQRDFVKILDFGISKFNPLNDEGMSMTRTGTVMGTPFYMAPEQAKGSKDIDHRSDLYSVGVILYEAITGQKPFHAGTFNELIFKIVLDTPPAPEHFVPNLDPAFSRVVRRSMAREPDERYQTATQFRDALSVWLHTGRSDDDDGLTPPPAGADDGGATRLQDPPEAATHLFQPDQQGPGTELISPSAEPPAAEQSAVPGTVAMAPDGPAVPPPGPAPQPPGAQPSPPPPPRPPQAPPQPALPQGAAQPPQPPQGQAPALQGGDELRRIPHQPLPANAPTPMGRNVPPDYYAEEPVASVAGVPHTRKSKGRSLGLVVGGTVFLLIGAIAAVAFLLPGQNGADTAASQSDPVEAADEDEAPEETADDTEGDDTESEELGNGHQEEGTDAPSDEEVLDLDAPPEDEEDEEDGREGDDAAEPPPPPPPRVTHTPPPAPPSPPAPQPPRPQPPKPEPEPPGGRQIKTEL